VSNTTIPKPEELAASQYGFAEHNADLDYFIVHQDELVEKYNGKVLLIHHQKFEGACDNILSACTEGDTRFGAGNFSIQKCIPGPKAYTMTIRNLDLSNAR
jgi:hypothetical protein